MVGNADRGDAAVDANPLVIFGEALGGHRASLVSCNAGIAVRDEGQWRNGGSERLAPDHEIDRRADLGTIGRHIAHGNRRADTRAEATGSNDAKMIAKQGQYLRAIAGGRAAIGSDANPLALWAVCQFGPNAVGAGEATLAAAALLQGPCQCRLNRARGLIDVKTVKTQSRFQAQRVASPKADG